MFSSSSARLAAAAAIAATACYSAAAMAQEGSGSGEIRRVDAAAGKVTIKHGAIGELDLPAITLVYLIDVSLLAGLQPGDKVKFTARRVDGQYVVVKISK
ncbi:copper-binding protein [Alcaligenaceae bacterium]|nr:copper-binding protein [Alcaligenaceae bacterium]